MGQPWGKTALVTGWGMNDQSFTPNDIEDYYTASYAGLSHRFSNRMNVEALAEDLRTWRIFGPRSGIAQSLRPAGTFTFSPTRRWTIQANASYSNNRSFHAYDAVQGGFSISYVRAFHRTFNAESGKVSVQYPIRFSAGIQQQDFLNFSQGTNQQYRPYISITLF